MFSARLYGMVEKNQNQDKYVTLKRGGLGSERLSKCKSQAELLNLPNYSPGSYGIFLKIALKSSS